MNNIIKEIEKKAQKVVAYTDGGYTEIKNLDVELFAELIVQECSRWIKSQDEADHPTAWLLCDELEKHFGVKS